MNIPKIKLINEAEMPVLGLGTWDLKGINCVDAVKKAIELGYRHIDTAELYENEEEIGEAIKDFKRKELFITSKISPKNLTYDGVFRSFENSLSKLKTDYLDLYLIHWPEKFREDVYKAFKELYSEKKIRAFGVSNFKVSDMKRAFEICGKEGLPVAVNQVEFHPFLNQKKILDYCDDKGVLIISYSPLARRDILGNSVLKEISKKYNKSPAQVSLRWLLDKGTAVIPKASSEGHLKENIDVFDFKLDKDDAEKIDGLDE